MVSKLDKTKKRFPSEQLSLTEPLENDHKAKKKKTTLIISLSLCIGLSIVFATYRTISRIVSEKKYPKININIKIPNFKLTPAKSIDLDTEVDPVIKGSDALWSFYVETLPKTEQSFSWIRNRDQLFINDTPGNVSSQLQKKGDNPDSLVKNSLPEGTKIKENQVTGDNYFEYQSIITVPGKQIFLVIKTSGGNNLENSKTLIPLLVEKIYWAVIKI